MQTSPLDVAVVGAGAAGIGAAKALAKKGLSFVVLEASHRIGGRGHTEELSPGVPFDLGCHWLHSASLNPFVRIADKLGFSYSRSGYGRAMFRDGVWLSQALRDDCEAYYEATRRNMRELAGAGEDCSVYDSMDRESPWATVFDYWMSLETSADTDQVSMLDLVRYQETGEDWPVREGYGGLIAAFAADVPVSLNCPVRAVRWGGPDVRIDTPKGTVSARAAIVTVSTGILGAGDIEFSPELPLWKREAFTALPLGNHNRICLRFARNVFGDDHPTGFSFAQGDGEQMWYRVRPFGFEYVVGVTGGRFAWWLEKAGTEASADYARECLIKMYGSAITKHNLGHKVTAWGGDPWVRGAYSAAQPGRHDQREVLRRPVDERLYFAGEATSATFFCTAHGAYLTGIGAADTVAARLSGKS